MARTESTPVVGVETRNERTLDLCAPSFLKELANGITPHEHTGRGIPKIVALRIESHEGLQGVITLLSLPLFFASNALYPVKSLPAAIRMASYVNPLSHFVNGFRYFSLGSNFYAFGVRYTFSLYDILVSLAFLIVFDSVTYLIAVRTIKKVKIV